MKKLVFLSMCLTVVLYSSAFGEIIFEDNFESYNVGTFPGSGGWVMGPPFGTVEISTDNAYTDSQSLIVYAGKLPGGLGAYIIYEDYLTLETAVYIAALEDHITILLWSGDGSPVTFEFKGGKIAIGYSDASGVTGIEVPYTTNTWYKLKAVCNFQAGTFDAYIDDSLVANGLLTGGYSYEVLGIIVYDGLAYLDDVKVSRVIDSDGDGIPDDVDNCPSTPNGPNGGTCSAGIVEEPCMSHGDCGCEGECSMDQEDSDEDGIGDVCDNITDMDNDGIPDDVDNCPVTPNGPEGGTCSENNMLTCMTNGDCGCFGFCSMDQGDADGDGTGDVCDSTTNTTSIPPSPLL